MTNQTFVSSIPQEKTAPHVNGFVALIANIAGTFVSISCIVLGIIRLANESFLIGGVLLAIGVLCLVCVFLDKF